jgi:hypothetical protein
VSKRTKVYADAQGNIVEADDPRAARIYNSDDPAAPKAPQAAEPTEAPAEAPKPKARRAAGK